MHNPAAFAALPGGSAPVTLAAHTHGGQVRLPFGLFPEWSWMTLVREAGFYGEADGWIDGYGRPGNRLYINRGIGFSIIPMRLFCPPEATLITLRAAPAGVRAIRSRRVARALGARSIPLRSESGYSVRPHSAR
jgi:predicted MPP superfamily phosphohydrolase